MLLANRGTSIGLISQGIDLVLGLPRYSIQEIDHERLWNDGLTLDGALSKHALKLGGTC